MAVTIDQYLDDSLDGTLELGDGDGGGGAIVLRRQPTRRRALVDTLCQVFLPRDYPSSVSDDYLEYQIWDTLQAFCSCITGALATRAVLQGMGVGDAEATPLAATITWLLKDGTSMVGQIVFAWRSSAALDARCKQWRLFADVLNDAAICLELATPTLGRRYFTGAMVVSGLAKSLVGVAGGATRAAIVQHQARHNNMADLSVKDGSQERVVGLAGLLTTMALLPMVDTGGAVSWLLFAAFTALHVFTNYRAVRAVCMAGLNEPRLRLVLDAFLSAGGGGGDLSVRGVNRRERLLLGGWPAGWRLLLGGWPAGWRLLLGAAPQRLAGCAGAAQLRRLAALYAGRPYLLLLERRRRRALVCLRRGAGVEDQVAAALAAAVAVVVLEAPGCRPAGPVGAQLDGWDGDDWQAAAEAAARALLPRLLERLRAEGWALERTLLEPGDYRADW